MRRERVTIRDIARHLDCSHVTVSMVLNNRQDYSVAAATRKRIVDEAARVGYMPNLLGRALVSGKTQTVALWINRLHASVYSAYYAKLLEITSLDGYRFGVSQGQLWDNPFSHKNTQIDWPSDGVIAVDTPQRIDDWMSLHGQSPMPIISVGPFTTTVVDSVTIDLASGTRDAVTYLIKSGRRRIEDLVERGSVADNDSRLCTFETVLRGAGMAPKTILAESQTRESAFIAVTERLKSRPLPDAIFAHTDILAAGAMRAIVDAGLSIPGDVAVIGVDDIEECQFMNPRLSTVAQPLNEACELAWNLLSARMADPGRPLEHHVLPASLVLRESSG